jgi:hypothetical protein
VEYNLNVLGMVRVFLWKAHSNLLPNKENLLRNAIVQDPLCPICGLDVKTMHVPYFVAMSRDEYADNSNIRICKMQIMGFNIHIMRLPSASVRLMQIINASIIRYWHLR